MSSSVASCSTDVMFALSVDGKFREGHCGAARGRI